MTKELIILLGDDNAEDHRFFSGVMQALNLPHRIVWARQATELFSALKRETHIDLVILDISIPGRDGKECLKEIKSNERYRDIPVIVLTMSKSEKDIEEVFRHRAHYYAIKPYSHLNYVETLRKIFKIDWKIKQPMPEKDDFVINLAYI
jgi:CheY-like chemotaxis protein